MCNLENRLQSYIKYGTQRYRDTEFFVFLIKFFVSLYLCV